jgi:uncharacterized protein (TIGR02246 family)
MRKRKVFGLAFGLAVTLAFGLLLAVGAKPTQGDEDKDKGDAAPGKGQRAQEFIAAYNAGDAKAVAGFWTQDGEYIDQEDHHFKGRAAIEKVYDKAFAENKGAKLAIHVTSVRQVTSDVALEEGVTEVTPADGGPAAVTKFSAVLVKKDGVWYLESVRDSASPEQSNADHFEDLEWLIGDWTGEAEKGESATASYTYTENQNFMICSFTTTLNGIPVVGGTQWIGWDPIAKQVRSWSFYSGGGFGEAFWTKEGNTWTVKTTATTAAGKKASVTNLITKVDAEHITWQATKLTVDGKEIPDASPVKMKRVKTD